VLYGIVLYGLFQSAIAIGQALSLVSSPHRFFAITGTIGNPGPLGGFLAVAVVCSFALLRQAVQKKKLRWTLINGTIACFLITGLILTDSRAAFLSATIGLLVVWSDKIWNRFKKHKMVISLSFAGIVVVLLCCLYYYRHASADARLLIWQVSARIVIDKPLCGHGIGAFNREYMLYQAAYFEQHPQSSFVMVADNVAYPYNEFLHVLIELGIIGGILLIAVFIAGFTTRSSGIIDRSLKAGLATFIVFSLFSYPVVIFELLLLPAIFLGTLLGRTFYTLRIFYWMKLIGIVLLISITVFAVAEIRVAKKTFEEIVQLTISDTKIPTPYCDRYFFIFVYNINFNTAYLSALCQLPCQLDYWPKIKRICPSSETFCQLGEACECYGQYEQAEQFYRKAANMVPTRIVPNYHLWQLYIKQGYYDQAQAIAQKILSQPVKVETTFTLRIKGQVKQYLLQLGS